MRMRLLVCAGVATVAAVPAPVAFAGHNPQVAGLQVALRAKGLYYGAIDAIPGPLTIRAVGDFQRAHHLPVTGHAGPRTRRALGALGRPLYGKRLLTRGEVGWDVAVLQYLLARHGCAVPVNGYFDGATVRGVRRFQRHAHLVVDGMVGPRTRAALSDRAPRARRVGSISSVGALLGHWAAHYGVNVHLVRGLAWMESGYNNRLVSSTGARGIMQIEPYTWRFVETVLVGRHVRHGPSGNVHVGVAYLHHLLSDFHGNERLALAGWYQGERAVREHGVYRQTRRFVADVLALAARM
ncbi:MAG TPA: peptidoglycan-binding protein [Gaiellaceae bacterium]|nr:peptidoglycan-binding protein [Gaiellaceae bacterium]